jgi:hypothetical protein
MEPGDRVSHKRRGCRRELGTVLEVDPDRCEDGAVWVRVNWDSGNVCWWEADRLMWAAPQHGRRR